MRETDSLLINYGGKSRIAASLVQHFPKGPQCYVEPFFGGGGIYFAVPQELYPVRVINDLNKSIVTFYKVLRERPEDLYRVCSLTPYAFDEQRACRDITQDPQDDELELARRVWVRQRQNFGGRQGANTGWRRGTHTMSMAACTDEKLQQFHAFADRMRRVEINNTDAVELIQDYAKPGVFLYNDPPYYPEARKSNVDYTHEMSSEQHLKLAQALHAAANAGALVAISGYDCEFYNSQYGNWRRVEYEHTVSSTNFVDAEQRHRTEIMWMNYPATVEIGANWKPAVKAKDSRERALLSMLRNQGKVGR